MKVLRIALFVVASLIGLILVLGLAAPKSYHVERSVEIDAAKEIVFDKVRYWKNWASWSPRVREDTTLRVAFFGRDGMIGSGYKWHGETAGAGEMATTAIKTDELAYHIKFTSPWKHEAEGHIDVAESGSGTRAVWAFHGEAAFPMNILLLFMNMDGRAGEDLSRGLAMLKDLSETEEEAARQYTITPVVFSGGTYAAIRKKMENTFVADFFPAAYSLILPAIPEKGLKVNGPACGFFYSWDDTNQEGDMAAAIPVDAYRELGEETVMITLPKSKAYLMESLGLYRRTSPAYRAMHRFVAKNGLVLKPPVIEEYDIDPEQMYDMSKSRTKIYFFAE